MTDEIDDTPNEILAAVRDAKAKSEAAARAAGGEARRWPLATIGLGVGIGSAAIAAALIYANRDRRPS